MRIKKPKMPHPTTVDFETSAILPRPLYPPRPVGVSIKKWGQKPRYYAWGHFNGTNNCTEAEAVAALEEAYACPDGVLFMNAKFDVEVAEVHHKIPVPVWNRIHDVMFLIFLHDPHQRSLDLKTTSERLLGMPPDEQDAVADWLVANQPVPGVRISRSKQGKEPYGKYIAHCPPEIVGPYANGDSIRTEAMFKKLWQDIADRSMLVCYDREREFMPCILDMERRGIRVDVERLKADVATYREVKKKVVAWIAKRLKAPADFNIDSAAEVLALVDAAGVVDTSVMGRTKTGKVSTNKESMEVGCSDKVLRAMLQYYGQLKTCLGTFMENWLETALQSGGLIFTQWNQVRSPDGGTRTGRMSSSDPNFQNMPKEFQALFAHDEAHLPKRPKVVAANDRTEYRKGLPVCPIKDLPHLPYCRSYIIPFREGDVLVGRDYSQQEPRILAHFEDGALMEQYLEDPWIDYHDNARAHLERIFKKLYPRKNVKTINLGIIYGMGVGKMAKKNNQPVEEAAELKTAILALYPGLDDMYNEMKRKARAKEPFRTWGGREVYCEPAIIFEGKFITFDYKMINYLVQGSAADCTKEAVIRYYRTKPKNHFLQLLVHDELVASVPAKDMVKCQAQMAAAMESVEFDVKILSEGSYSNDNWNAMRDFDKKGKRVA